MKINKTKSYQKVSCVGQRDVNVESPVRAVMRFTQGCECIINVEIQLDPCSRHIFK